MSRAYRIQISESVERIIHVEDGVCSQLDILPVLDRDSMGEILGQELVKKGFTRDGDKATREDDDGTVEVDLKTGNVSVRIESSKDVKHEVTDREVTVDSDFIEQGRQQHQERIKKELDEKVNRETQELQEAATKRLEGKVKDLRPELDAVVNRVTAEALKKRASQMGEIEEVVEDEAGGMVIKVRL